MAKINHILFGQGKGKVGGLVLQRYEGLNVVREKPISVKNPQSTKQTAQRAKLKLASQITAQFYYVLRQRLAKISIYDRSKRSTAINAIIGIINTNQPSTPAALLDNVLGAINAKSMSDFLAPSLTSRQAGTASITATSGDTVFYALAEYDNEGNFTDGKTETFVSDGNAKLVEGGGDQNVVMVVSVRATTDAGRAAIGNATFSGEGASIQWSNEISRSIASGDIEVSSLTGIYF